MPRQHSIQRLGTHRPRGWDEAVVSRTRLNVCIAAIKLMLSYLLVGLITYGVGLLSFPVLTLVGILRYRRNLARIEGTCVRATRNQFPEVHALAMYVAQRVGLRQEPEIYIGGHHGINAFVSELGRTRQIVLTPELISGAAKTHDAGVLEFVIAHEVAHAYFGHIGSARSILRYVHTGLSRLDEFTADRAAASFVADKRSCALALALLVVGPECVGRLNLDELLRQASFVARNKHTRRAEKRDTHPLLLHRLAKVMQYLDELQIQAKREDGQPNLSLRRAA